MSLPIAATPTLNAEESERFLAMVEEGLKHPCGPVPTPRIEKALDKLDKKLRKPKPFYGGLITDPLLERVRKLEERIARLEAMLP